MPVHARYLIIKIWIQSLNFVSQISRRWKKGLNHEKMSGLHSMCLLLVVRPISLNWSVVALSLHINCLFYWSSLSNRAIDERCAIHKNKCIVSFVASSQLPWSWLLNRPCREGCWRHRACPRLGGSSRSTSWRPLVPGMMRSSRGTRRSPWSCRWPLPWPCRRLCRRWRPWCCWWLEWICTDCTTWCWPSFTLVWTKEEIYEVTIERRREGLLHFGQ